MAASRRASAAFRSGTVTGPADRQSARKGRGSLMMTGIVTEKFVSTLLTDQQCDTLLTALRCDIDC